MVGLVEDIVDTDAWNKFKQSANGKGVGRVQIYYAIAGSIVIARIISGRLEAAVEVHTEGVVAPSVVIVGSCR